MSQNILAKNYLIIGLYFLCISLSVSLYYIFEVQKSQHLSWILYPVTKLTELSTGIHFIADPPNGFVNHYFNFRIEESCSGIKFLIIIWTMSIFSFLSLLKESLKQVWAFVLLALAAYIWTVIANASRITGAIFLYKIGDTNNWSNANTLHLAEGILFYAFFAISYYFLLQFIFRRLRNKNPTSL